MTTTPSASSEWRNHARERDESLHGGSSVFSRSISSSSSSSTDAHAPHGDAAAAAGRGARAAPASLPSSGAATRPLAAGGRPTLARSSVGSAGLASAASAVVSTKITGSGSVLQQRLEKQRAILADAKVPVLEI